jgi:hypothetical protein
MLLHDHANVVESLGDGHRHISLSFTILADVQQIVYQERRQTVSKCLIAL